MELGEMVAAAVPSLGDDECPFDHEETQHDRENVLPPPSTKNNATTLSNNLDGKSLHLPPAPVTLFNGSKSMAKYTAHHLVPGNESWPKSDLHKWIDKEKGHIKGDIGYDVNNYRNGVDLPGNSYIDGWSAKVPNFQTDYAFTSMEADTDHRQFHDRHAAYSDFVIQALNKIAAKLDARKNNSHGCGKKNCPGNKAAKPFDPPYNVLDLLYQVADRMKGKLVCSFSQWKEPIITSRFAMMYKDRKLTQDDARKLLETSNFNY